MSSMILGAVIITFVYVIFFVILGVFIEKRELRNLEGWIKKDEILERLYAYACRMGLSCSVRPLRQTMGALKNNSYGWCINFSRYRWIKPTILIPLDYHLFCEVFFMNAFEERNGYPMTEDMLRVLRRSFGPIESFAHEIGHAKARLAAGKQISVEESKNTCGQDRQDGYFRCLFNDIQADLFAEGVVREIGVADLVEIKKDFARIPFCKKAIKEGRCPKIAELEVIYGEKWKTYLG